MKHSATSSELAAQPEVARASWPLPEPTLTYFPNARFAISDRDPDARAHRAPSGATTH
ncbi:16S rRNA (cytosine(1402)-N(4))-methyltransferase, partial [Mycolicibacterium sphagni]|nr:16S rRNA (cytosine(1402)-N(4))-methyltransferase [Mycolicibacterium sphagni]